MNVSEVESDGASLYRKVGKRWLDCLLVAPIFLILLPFLFLIGGLVKIKLGSPVLFQQRRPGLHGRIFTMWKFRTMTEERDASGVLFPDAVRLTPFGRFLRSSSLDELPELWNVLKGEMSLVGPRPLLMEYLPLYTEEQNLRHEVLPGITGWAQVKGRNALTWDEKFTFDIWYVTNYSFLLDIKILLLTLWKAFRREGVNASDKVTMPRFEGSRVLHEDE